MNRILTAALLSACLFAPTAGGAAPQQTPKDPRGPSLLFLNASPKATLRADDPAVVRSRPVRINFDALLGPAGDPQHPERRERLILNLFPDVRFTALLDSGLSAAQSGFAWIGRIEGSPESRVTLVAAGGLLTGSVSTRSAVYRVRPTAAGVQMVEEIDTSRYPEEAEPIPVFPDKSFEPGDLKLLDDGSTFDLLVVYTPAARAAAGGTTAIQNLIALGVAETNIAYANSLIPARLRLVSTAETSYTESGDIGTDLSRLRSPSDGYMDEVHALRNTYKADLVQLIGESMAGGCGIGYLMSGNNNRSFESSAFTYVARLCVSPNYSFGHELGHNMGSNHAPDDSGLGTGAFSYSFGYKNPAAGFRTIMSYDCTPSCTRLLYFSNPAVTYSGYATGTSTQNNANSITNVRSVVANFRQAAPQTTCNGTAGQWSGCRGNGCSVCNEKVSSYPLYFVNHPACAINYTCGGQYFTCNSSCPSPTSTDQCNGTSGQWSGCRGDGCSVCEELTTDYPLYFFNHPACSRNHQCGGQYFTCNVNCPSPASGDRCDGTPGEWSGCRGNGCSVCSELVDSYKCYFQNHPKCSRNTICGGLYFTCNANCPAPTSADNC